MPGGWAWLTLAALAVGLPVAFPRVPVDGFDLRLALLPCSPRRAPLSERRMCRRHRVATSPARTLSPLPPMLQPVAAEPSARAEGRSSQKNRKGVNSPLLSSCVTRSGKGQSLPKPNEQEKAPGCLQHRGAGGTDSRSRIKPVPVLRTLATEKRQVNPGMFRVACLVPR